MKFSQLAWQQNEANYQAIVQQPFNQELMNGTLAHEKFAYYIEQDSFIYNIMQESWLKLFLA